MLRSETCQRCRRLDFTNDTIKRLLKKQRICLECYINKERPYTIGLLSSYDDPCGGSCIYRIQPKKQSIRLHNIAHYEVFLPENCNPANLIPVSSWEEIWGKMDGWMDPRWATKHKGKLRRGIYYYNGNGMIAFVEDKKGDIYYIDGVWG